MTSQRLIENVLDEVESWGWRRESACASRTCNDPRFALVVEPFIAGGPSGTFFGCDVGIRSFRHQALADWATEGALATCALTRRLGQRWYPHFFAGGSFQLALDRRVSFGYRPTGTIGQRKSTLREALVEVRGNIDKLEDLASDEKIATLCSRDRFGPSEVGKAFCCAILGDAAGVTNSLSGGVSSWFPLRAWRESVGGCSNQLKLALSCNWFQCRALVN